MPPLPGTDFLNKKFKICHENVYIKCFKINKVYLHKHQKNNFIEDIHRNTREIISQPPMKQVFIKATNEVDVCHPSCLHSIEVLTAILKTAINNTLSI